MFRQHEAPRMSRQHRARTEIVGGLGGLVRHHVNVFPVLVVLTVLHNRQIHGAKLFADGFEVRAVTAIAAVVNLLLRRDEHKAGPQRLITLQPPTGEMTGRQDMHGQFVADLHRLIPVRFADDGALHAPVAQMRSHAERRHHALDFWHQRFDGGVIQMVVVIVRNNQQVYLRHTLCTPRIVTRESFINK